MDRCTSRTSSPATFSRLLMRMLPQLSVPRCPKRRALATEVGHPREGKTESRNNLLESRNNVWMRGFRRPLTSLLKMKRHFLGSVRAGFANPVRAVLTIFVVQSNCRLHFSQVTVDPQK